MPKHTNWHKHKWTYMMMTVIINHITHMIDYYIWTGINLKSGIQFSITVCKPSTYDTVWRIKDPHRDHKFEKVTTYLYVDSDRVVPIRSTPEGESPSLLYRVTDQPV